MSPLEAMVLLLRIQEAYPQVNYKTRIHSATSTHVYTMRSRRWNPMDLMDGNLPAPNIDDREELTLRPIRISDTVGTYAGYDAESDTLFVLER